MASRGSGVVGQLLRTLALRLKVSGASPLTPQHIPGDENAMTDVPSRSFGSRPEWHCRNDHELLTMFNEKFPLPNQNSWTVFRPSNAVLTRVISVLQMQPSTMDEWRRLPEQGRHVGEIGPATPRVWEWTLTFRKHRTSGGSEPSQDSRPECEQGSTEEAVKSGVARCLKRSRPLERRFPWPWEKTQPKKATLTSSPQDSNR